MIYESYENWLLAQGISGVSPEATYAEMAWNAAIARVQQLHVAGLSAESGDAMRARGLLDIELEALKTNL